MEAEMTTSERLLSVSELAELLQVPVPTIYRWRSTGQAPKAFRAGRHLRFAMTDVVDWMERRKD